MQVLSVRQLGVQLPDGAVYIGRRSATYGLPQSVWANPYRLGADGDRATVVRRYYWRLQRRPDLMERLGELEGCDLVCWCAPLMCHGDVLRWLITGQRHGE